MCFLNRICSKDVPLALISLGIGSFVWVVDWLVLLFIQLAHSVGSIGAFVWLDHVVGYFGSHVCLVKLVGSHDSSIWIVNSIGSLGLIFGTSHSFQRLRYIFYWEPTIAMWFPHLTYDQTGHPTITIVQCDSPCDL